MTNDEAKKKILARRASFVAAALATVACQKEPADQPQPCLSPPVNTTPPDAGAPEPMPMPCLTPVHPGPPSALDSAAPATSAPPPKEPAPCLKIAPPPRDAGAKPIPSPPPQPCLTPMRPEDVKK